MTVWKIAHFVIVHFIRVWIINLADLSIPKDSEKQFGRAKIAIGLIRKERWIIYTD